jgi:hypothetical protein
MAQYGLARSSKTGGDRPAYPDDWIERGSLRLPGWRLHRQSPVSRRRLRLLLIFADVASPHSATRGYHSTHVPH